MKASIETISDDDRNRALELDHEIRTLVLHMRHDFVTLGELMLKMEATRGWLLLANDDGEVYPTYDAWVRDLPQSRALAFAAKRVVKELGPIVPRHLLVEIDRNKLELLRELARMAPRKVTPQVVEAAVKDNYLTFASLVRQHAPIEPRHRLVFEAELSQSEKISEILDWAAWELTETGEPVMSRIEALEMALVEWQQDRQKKTT